MIEGFTSLFKVFASLKHLLNIDSGENRASSFLCSNQVDLKLAWWGKVGMMKKQEWRNIPNITDDFYCAIKFLTLIQCYDKLIWNIRLQEQKFLVVICKHWCSGRSWWSSYQHEYFFLNYIFCEWLKSKNITMKIRPPYILYAPIFKATFLPRHGRTI